MRKVLAFALAGVIVGLAQAPAPITLQAGKASIEWHVTSITGEALGNATVGLRRSSGGTATDPTATTDALGRFVFDAVEPGEYIISADRSGFLAAANYWPQPEGSLAQVRTTVAPGEHRTGVLFRLLPEGVLSGRVVDANGDPVEHPRVTLLLPDWNTGKRELTEYIVPVDYGAAGTFAFKGLTAGRYYLRAAAPEVQRNPAEDLNYVATFYPSVVDAFAAVPVGVAPGKTVGGVEIRLRKEPVYSIRGKVIDPEAGPVKDAVVSLARLDGLDRRGGGKPSDVFQFDGIPSGAYVLQAKAYTPQGFTLGFARPTHVGREIVVVGKQNLDDVVIQFLPGANIAGRVVYEGSRGTSPGGRSGEGNLSVHATGITEWFAPDSPVAATGKVLLENVAAGNYRARLYDYDPQAYLKSIHLGG